MHSEDPFVRSLQALCARVGGHKAVAEKAGLSAENLNQILVGTKLPSGNPRGVGPRIRKRLSEVYPDWLEGELSLQHLPKGRTTNISPGRPTPRDTLSSFASGLAAIEEVLANLNGLLQRPARELLHSWLDGRTNTPETVKTMVAYQNASLQLPASAEALSNTPARVRNHEA